VIEDHSWQAKAGAGFDRAQFVVDWEQRQVTCPAGKQSISWLPHTYPASGWQWEARFSARDCTPCAFRPQCTRRKSEPRILGLQNQAEYEALERMRQHQRTAEFRQQYAARAGIEGTHEQAIRRCGLRQCRYVGMAKTHLQHLLTAAAINLVRMAEWWAGRAPAQTRRSAFRKLQPQAA
jgi:transposase